VQGKLEQISRYCCSLYEITDIVLLDLVLLEPPCMGRVEEEPAAPAENSLVWVVAVAGGQSRMLSFSAAAHHNCGSHETARCNCVCVSSKG